MNHHFPHGYWPLAGGVCWLHQSQEPAEAQGASRSSRVWTMISGWKLRWLLVWGFHVGFWGEMAAQNSRSQLYVVFFGILWGFHRSLINEFEFPSLICQASEFVARFFLGCPIWITQHIVSQNWKSSPKSAKIGLSKFQTYLNGPFWAPNLSSVPGGENRRRLHGGGRMKRSPRSQCTYGRYACGMLASWFFGCLTRCFDGWCSVKCWSPDFFHLVRKIMK